jgi:hypothetical protein
VWAPLLRLEREVRAATDAERAASGGGMEEGHGEESEEEHDVSGAREGVGWGEVAQVRHDAC